MWNDEDNNPYGAFDRPVTEEDALQHHHEAAASPLRSSRPTTPLFGQQTPSYIASMDTPSRDSTSPSIARGGGRGVSAMLGSPTGSSFEGNNPLQRPDSDDGRTADDDDDDPFVTRTESDRDELENVPVDLYGRPLLAGHEGRGGMYRNRIQQILEDNPELPILIVDAGKNVESGGSYIVYTIRTGDLEVRRRYSEFSSLREVLVQLHPTLIIPPIPSKHSVADYAAKPTRAKEDLSIIDLRKRMLQVFLNRCRSMKAVREDGVWWRFLDPNANWNEVLHSPPVSLIPKNLMKAPPVNPWHPLPAHAWLPIPSTSAKLKNSTATNQAASMDSAATIVPPQTSIPPEFLPRFPPTTRTLSEAELDPYFINYEHSTKELETLLNGNIEKVNRRTLAHLATLSTDLMDLGARLNAFSLSESSRSLASAIEQTGQAFDRSYILTSELNSSLSATFSEPMRELAQFASVVRSVVRYRVLKRVQQEMTKDELERKRIALEVLEKSEMEARRIDSYLNRSAVGSPNLSPAQPRRTSTPEVTAPRSPTPLNVNERPPSSRGGNVEDTSSIDSDFKHDYASTPSVSAAGGSMIPPSPSRHQTHQSSSYLSTPRQSTPLHRKSSSMTGKFFGRISHAVHGFVDVDPEKTRRDQMGKTKESLRQLEQAQQVSEMDVQLASEGVLADLKRFQQDQEDDLRRYMVAYARCHLDWARKNLETWTEAKDEIDKIDVR